MDYFDRIQNCTTLDELFDEWRTKEPCGCINHGDNVFIPDGIVCPEVWGQKGKKKILFVLKEAYGQEWGGFTLASWLHTYPKRRIWDRVSRVVYGIQNTDESKIQRYKSVLSEDEFRTSIDQIAVLNLKKSGGKSQSDSTEIAEYAAFDCNEIKKELELIDADIIICGYTFQILCENVFQKTISVDEKCDNWYYHINLFGKDRLFIDYYHPAIHDSDLMFYYGIVGIYQQSLLETHIISLISLSDCNGKMCRIDSSIFDFAFKMAFRDATMRNAFKRDGAAENLTETKTYLSDNLKPIVREYIDSIFEGNHPQPIDYILRISNADNCELNLNGRFTFGNAQKLVNMTAKYMFLSSYHDENMRNLFDNCDCPMDSFMIQKVDCNPDRKFTHSLSWSNILASDYDSYEYFQEQIKEKCKDEFPIEYDFLHWDE